MVRFIRRMALSTFPSSTTTPTYDRFFCADEMKKLLFCNTVRVVVVDAGERRGVVWRKALKQEEKDFKPEGFKNACNNGKEEEDDDDLKESDESALPLPLFKHDDDDDDDDDDDESTLEKTFARRNILYLNLFFFVVCFLWEQK